MYPMASIRGNQRQYSRQIAVKAKNHEVQNGQNRHNFSVSKAHPSYTAENGYTIDIPYIT